MKRIPIILTIFLFLGLVSCVKNLDFKQVEDLELTPTTVVSLAYFTIPQESFFNGVTEISELTETSGFTLFEKPIAQKELQKIKFESLITNEFNRDVEIVIRLLDTSKMVAYAFEPIQIPANTLGYKFSEQIALNSNPKILSSKFTEVTVKLSTGSPLQSGKKIIVQSDVLLTFKF